MPSKHEDDLKRVSAQGAAITDAAHASSREGQDHIRSSRSAIERSVELLARTFNRVRN